MYNLCYEEIKAELPYVESTRLRKALVILNCTSQQAFDELYFELMTFSRLDRERLIERIRLAYKEVK